MLVSYISMSQQATRGSTALPMRSSIGQQMEGVTNASLLYFYLTAGNERANSCLAAFANKHLADNWSV